MLYILQLVFVAYSAASLVLELFECFTETAVSSWAVRVPCSHGKWKRMKLSVFLRKANAIINVFPSFCYFGWIDFFRIGWLFLLMMVMVKCKMWITNALYYWAFCAAVLLVFNCLSPGVCMAVFNVPYLRIEKFLYLHL